MPQLQSAYLWHHSTEPALSTGPVWYLRCCRRSTSNAVQYLWSQRCLQLRWSRCTSTAAVVWDRRYSGGVGYFVSDWPHTSSTLQWSPVSYIISHLRSSIKLKLRAIAVYTIDDCGLVSHSYVDDTHTCISVPATNALVAMQHLAVCIKQCRYRLKMNRTGLLSPLCQHWSPGRAIIQIVHYWQQII